MFRGAIVRASRAVPGRITSYVLRTTTEFSRLNSSVRSADATAPGPTVKQRPRTQEEQARRDALDAQNHLQTDWHKSYIMPYEEFYGKTQNPSPSTFIIDVREPDEVIQGMIPSSVNLPLSVLSGGLKMPAESFQKKFGFSKPESSQEVIFYCRSGVRSSSATDIARRNGYTNVHNYKGSWLEWTEKHGQKHPQQ